MSADYPTFGIQPHASAHSVLPSIAGGLRISFIYCQEKESKHKYLIIGLALFDLCLIKTTAIAFGLFIVLFIAFIKEKDRKRKGTVVICLILACIFSYLSWYAYLKINNINDTNFEFSWSDIIDFAHRLVGGKTTIAEQKAIRDIIQRFFIPDFQDLPMGISPCCWLLILVPLLLLSKRNAYLKRLFPASCAFIVLWTIGVLITYIIVFHYDQGYTAFRRYIPSAVIACVTAFVMVFSVQIDRKGLIIMICIGLVAAFVIAPARVNDFLYPDERISKEQEYREQFGDMYISDALKNGEKALIVYEDEQYPLSGSLMGYLLYYYNVIPQNIGVDYDHMWDASRTVKDKRYVKDRILSSNADYIYFYRLPTNSIDVLSNYLDCDIEQNSYYRIDYQSDQIKLLALSKE